MRLLLLAYYFPPMGGMGSLRALSFAKHLPEAGVDVTVIAPRTGTYGHDGSLDVPPGVRVVRTGSLEPGMLVRRLRGGGGEGVLDELRVAGLGRQKRWLQKILHLPDANVGWVPAAVAAAVREASRRPYDSVLSTSPPLSAHLAASWTAGRLRLPFVADVRDFLEAQRLFAGWRERVDARVARRALRRVAGFVSPYRAILDDLRVSHPVPSVEIRNGFDEEDFAGEAGPPTDGPFRLVHVGSTYGERAPWEPLFRAASAVAAEGLDLRARFVGLRDDAVAAAAARAGFVDRVEFAGWASHADAVLEMRRASGLLLFSWAPEGRVGRGLVLGKTFEVLRAGRPVLYLGPPEGDSAALLGRLGGATVRSHGDEAGIAESLRSMLRGKGPAPVDAARLAPYTRRKQAIRLARWLDRLIGSPG